MKKRWLLIILLLPILAAGIYLSLIPYETTVVPEWKIVVVDLQGKRVPDAWVSQSWQHFSIEELGHEENTRTDINGEVVFSKRTIKASFARRFIGPIGKFMQLLFEAGYGPHSLVISLKDGYEGWLDYDEGKPLEHTLVLDFKNEIK